MDILRNNDSNYILGILVAFYSTYMLHNNLSINIHPIISLLILSGIAYIAKINIVLATILSISYLVTV